MPTDPNNARLADELERALPLLDGLETGRDCEEYAYAKAGGFQAMTYCPDAFEALRHLPAAIAALRQQVRAVLGGLEGAIEAILPDVHLSISDGNYGFAARQIASGILSTQPLLPDDVKAVIERLRRTTRVMVGNPGEVDYDGPVFEDRPVNPDGPEAATMLETLCVEIGRAVAMEREECAKVAEGWVAKNFAWSTIRRSTGVYIAKAIRARATLAGEGE